MTIFNKSIIGLAFAGSAALLSGCQPDQNAEDASVLGRMTPDTTQNTVHYNRAVGVTIYNFNNDSAYDKSEFYDIARPFSELDTMGVADMLKARAVLSKAKRTAPTK